MLQRWGCGQAYVGDERAPQSLVDIQQVCKPPLRVRMKKSVYLEWFFEVRQSVDRHGYRGAHNHQHDVEQNHEVRIIRQQPGVPTMQRGLPNIVLKN